MTDSARYADGVAQCPICTAESEYPWRCSECGKLFDDDAGSRENGRGVLGSGA